MIDVHAHADAFINALAARGVRVYDSGAGTKLDGSFETPVPPYAVVYIDGGLRSAESLGNDQEERSESDAEVWSVGKSPRSARAIRSEVLALVGVELAVPGRLVIVRSVFSDAIKPDRDDPRSALYQGRDGLTVVSLKS